MGLKGITIETPPQAEAHINAADDRAIWEAVIGMDGVVNVGQKLKATLISNNLLRVYDGALVVGGAVGRIPFGEYEDITINNGTQNQLRNDLVVTQIEANGAIENMKLHCIQGVPGEVAKDPDYTAGNVYEGETLRQYPLYRVKLNGLNVEAVEPLFEVLPNLGKVKDEVGELNRKIIYEFGACTNQLLISGQFRYFKINDIVFMSGRVVMNAKLAEIDFLPYQAKDSYDFSSCGYYTDDTKIAGYVHGRAQKGTSACSLWFNGPVTYGAVNFYYRTNGIKGKNFDQYTIEL